ncbi:hypothetical protein AAG906_007679 [Vitis piasezkii]
MRGICASGNAPDEISCRCIRCGDNLPSFSLTLLGFLCIIYSCYFRTRIHSRGFAQLGYFSGPWIIRIIFILFAIWWGFGEIIRNSLQVLHCFKSGVCRTLPVPHPCVSTSCTLTEDGVGILSQKWNGKQLVMFFSCLPVFALQLIVILIGPDFNKGKNNTFELPHYFTSTAVPSRMKDGGDDIALCTYPLLSTILLGFFATVLTTYLFWLGRRILNLVINKGLQRRVYTLIFSVSGFLPLRVLLLGLSVLYKPEQVVFEALAFLAFLSLLCCAGVSIWMLVYCPVADSLALRSLLDLEARRRISDDHNETISLIANQSLLGESTGVSPERNSDASTKRGSISFRTVEKDGTSVDTYVELSLFSPSRHATPPGSPRPLGWPMVPRAQVHGP